ncbi:purine-binding chemotaxis protein CheW [Halanaerobium saccharolyticum]|uniref:Purine-binding chemotaxis protein CheW n=1 Tax=Halanaerobium saccharolyticum TaxID=43595 RepID=A0A4R7YL99_9FIRM|nr:chemotaxis protein CheW [Halanaerobium saccharolyticum]RAK04918.1 purine-binding chemotaxis protein CheW [Halanaerobium saccharolyticum]TDV98290.1 purine-binding chemotaxis protein CheW [Halanaerobium saccharolyticum]TDX51228.1 purine-binding chemotaxis protein CheW [Halanaerobium saccharolyticum]
MQIKEISQDKKQYVIFYLADKKFGVNINQTKEILSNTEMTFVPDSPEFISGIINLRGSVVPVVNLKMRLNITGNKKDKEEKIIIVELDGLTAGMMVDDVKEIEPLTRENIINLPDLARKVDSDYIEGVGRADKSDELLLLLNLKNVLSNREIEELKNVDAGIDS